MAETIRERVGHHPVMDKHPTVRRALDALDSKDTDEVTKVILEAQLEKMCDQMQATGELFWGYYRGFPNTDSQDDKSDE